MKRIRKQERLPEGMALVETADGKWFPAFAFLSEIPHWIEVMEGPPLIPPALDTFHDPEPGHDCRAEAIEACHDWREVMELTEYWQGLAARTELYPERTAWYIDKIEQLTGGDDTVRLHYGLFVQAMVLTRGDEHSEIIIATGATPDEAIETLYQNVYEWSRDL
jgi:hypothetical protein